jgi:crossover junction endodeoxyribonuclease RuvC
MLILGIDPGTATTGYGTVSITKNGPVALDWGLIETAKEQSPSQRLLFIHQSMLALVTKLKPNVIAIERIFFATNAKTAIRVGQAQGVMLLAAATTNADIVEYAPGTIKKLVTGDGRADKKMIQQTLRQVFGAKVRSEKRKKTHFDNAADALAVALCHVYSVNGKSTS